ncbi:BRO1 domain-containing protein [Actinidia chinensis var. chinensis]|uniref:BRO1 domain-containing protein n=1 Tax=Actinidia chinensis var. chinensis TaxID=1590841 RepID=A0A2R6PH47_ACTCC|nr:BRO1 domain-containing protein [Actinidia chinensis var. chinensis]
MMMLRYTEPAKLKTKKIIFEDVYPARDSGTLVQLKELSSKRRAMEESINESRFITEAIAREISGGLNSHSEQDIQKLELYLPLLENLVYHVDLVSDNPRMVRQTSDLKIRWSSALSSSSFFPLTGPKFFQIDNLRFELGMTLFLYGAMLRELASEVLSVDLVQSATLFRKAAGVYHYLAHEVLPRLQSVLSPERPPEATSSVSSVMSLICLAEAQAVTIRKAEEKGNTGGLLSKLHYGVAQLLDEATVILHSATKECKDFSARLVEFISSCKALHELRSYKSLAEGLKDAGQIGVAVGILHHALNYVQKKMPGEESWRLVFKQEIDEVAALLRKYEHENEVVWYEKIPPHDELPIPEGKKIVSHIAYHPQRWERALVFKI